MSRIFKIFRMNFIESESGRKYFLYAIGEILLVMVGILLALQVNNWNQDRLERKKELVLLKEINSEFLFNKKEMENTIHFYKDIRSNGQNIIDLFPIRTDQLDLDSLSAYFDYSSFTPSFDVSRGSIAMLKNSASFEIISNEELRQWLVRFDDIVEDYTDRETRSRTFVMNEMEPYMRQYLPIPYNEGVKDPRADLSFLSTIEFENLMKHRVRGITNFLQIIEDPERDLVKAIDRIIELSSSSNLDL